MEDGDNEGDGEGDLEEDEEEGELRRPQACSSLLDGFSEADNREWREVVC